MTNKVLLQARFTFPFRLSLQKAAFTFRYGDSLTSVSTRSFLGKRIMILTEEAAGLTKEGSHWLRAHHPKPYDTDSREVKVRSGADPYLEEVRDTVGFTRMDITFEVDAGTVTHGAVGDLHAAEALRRAQHVIRVYRAHSQEFDVTIPQEGDSPIVELAVSDEYTFSETEAAGSFRVIEQAFHWNNPEITGILKPPMAENAVVDLVEQLNDPTAPELYRELMVEAKALSKLRSLHALSIVVAGTGLETYLQFRLRAECQLRGVTELTDDRGVAKVVEEAVLDGDLKRDLLGKYAEFLIGEPLRSSGTYACWHKDAYGPRRDIVHKGRTVATAEQAKAAFDAIVQLIQDVDVRLTASRPSGGIAV